MDLVFCHMVLRSLGCDRLTDTRVQSPVQSPLLLHSPLLSETMDSLTDAFTSIQLSGGTTATAVQDWQWTKDAIGSSTDTLNYYFHEGVSFSSSQPYFDPSTTPFSCDICGLSNLSSALQLASHRAGKKHQRMLDLVSEAITQARKTVADDFAFRCETCNVRTRSKKDYKAHMGGKRHRENNAGRVAIAGPGSSLNLIEQEGAASNPTMIRVIEEALNDLEILNYWLFMLQLPPQSTKKAARASLKRVNINLYDLLEGRFDRVFGSAEELGVYSRLEGKVFAKGLAKKNGYLKVFLRKIF